MRRNGKSLRANVFAKGEKRVMPAEIPARGRVAFVDLDLLHAGIAFDVKNAVALQQVVIEFLAPANIEDGIGVPVELPDLLQGKSGRRLFRMITRAKGPAPLKFKFPRQSLQQPGGIAESLRSTSNVSGLYGIRAESSM